MASKENDIKEHYAKNLKATDYVEYYIGDHEKSPEVLQFAFTFMYEVLKSGKFGGASALEIGSGALVHNIAPVSAFFTNIVMSDYVEDNCNELKKWLQGKSSIRQIMDITAKLEDDGRGLEIVQKSIEERIKARVKHVVRCDVFLDGILMEKLPLHSTPPYDLIISSFVFEYVAPDVKSYFQIYKRLNKLLRSGGGVMIYGSLGGKSWSVKNIVYHNIEISQDDMVNALMEAGFGEIDIKTQDKVYSVDYEYEKLICLAATKIIEIDGGDK